MNLWILIGHILLTGTFLLMSILFKKNPPQSINGLYGYRTPLSMKNKNLWDEAKIGLAQL